MTSDTADVSPQSKADQYNAVVAKARLLDVMLTANTFEVEHGFRGTEAEASKFFSEGCSDINFLMEEKMLLGQVRFRVWMNAGVVEQPKEKDSRELYNSASLKLEAKYIVAFDVPGDHEAENLTAFFERTATFTAWPYFRAFVAQLAAASEVDIPILPIKQLAVPLRTRGVDYKEPTPSLEADE